MSNTLEPPVEDEMLEWTTDDLYRVMCCAIAELRSRMDDQFARLWWLESVECPACGGSGHQMNAPDGDVGPCWRCDGSTRVAKDEAKP